MGLGSLFSSKTKTKSRTSQGVGGPALPYFERGFEEAEGILDRGPRVYQGQRVQGFSPETEEAFAGTASRARGNQKYLDNALGQLDETAAGRDYAPQEILDLIQSGGQRAANTALGAVNQQFQGSGFGSPLHSILGSQRAGEAIADQSLPTLANLFTGQQNRQEAAIRDIPGLYDSASTAQGNILRGIGAQRENLGQRQLDANQDKFNEYTVGEQQNADNYINQIMGLGQFFRTSKGKTKGKSKGSPFSTIAPLLGAGAGALIGGPAGAQLGSQIGSAAGGR